MNRDAFSATSSIVNGASNRLLSNKACRTGSRNTSINRIAILANLDFIFPDFDSKNSLKTLSDQHFQGVNYFLNVDMHKTIYIRLFQIIVQIVL